MKPENYSEKLNFQDNLIATIIVSIIVGGMLAGMAGCGMFYTRSEVIYEKEKSYQDGYNEGIGDRDKIEENTEDKTHS